MSRRIVAALLAVLWPMSAFLYAGRPGWAAAAALSGAVPVLALGAYTVGVLPGAWILPAFVVVTVVSWIAPPALAVALQPRVAPRWQRLPLYLLAAPVPWVVATSLMLVARASLAEPYQIPAASMSPALLPGDMILARKGAPFAPGDVIVFAYPPDPTTDYVKRVIATAGQTVEVRDGVVTIDGIDVPRVAMGEGGPAYDASCAPLSPRKMWEETLGAHTYTTLTDPSYAQQIIDFGPKTVPADALFVMGDNRDSSADSRIWGWVPLENVHGVVGDRWMSFDACAFEARLDRVGPVP